MTLFLLSFITGVLTVLAPCVLPLLPIIIGGSISGEQQDKRLRPALIAASLALSLFAFTLLLKATTAAANVSPDVWLYASGGIVIALGITSLFPKTWEVISEKLHLQQNSQKALESSGQNKRRFLGPILVGVALGPVFSSCSPTYAFILATVLPRDFSQGLVDLTAYCLGLVCVLLVVSIYGRAATQRVRWMANPHGNFRRILGVVFIAVGIAIVSGYDKKAQTWFADHSPIDISNVDKTLLGRATAGSQATQKPTADEAMGQPDLFNVKPFAAPAFAGLDTWINSDPQTIQSLKGKVVLVDFWTYSCINCLRTLPHVEQWYEHYKDEGLVVVGVHAPEFSFEHNVSNVRDNVKRLGVTYPVALDNNFSTWNAYENQYWPADYLIDRDGVVRNVHFGEGDYDKTERAIKVLLGDKSTELTKPAVVDSVTSDTTPETYFGTSRAERFAGSPALADGDNSYSAPKSLSRDQWALQGAWHVENEQIVSDSSDSVLRFHVHAKNVYVVAGNDSGAGQPITVSIDGQPDTTVPISGARLYQLGSFDSARDVTMTLKVPAGVALNTFTFG